MCSEVSFICTAWSRLFSDGLASAVSVAEHTGSPSLLQLLCSHLPDHCGCHQLCYLLLQRSGHQSTTVGPHQMVYPVSRFGTDLLQQSDYGGVGYNHSARGHNITHPSSLLCAWHSFVYHAILVCDNMSMRKSFPVLHLGDAVYLKHFRFFFAFFD